MWIAFGCALCVERQHRWTLKADGLGAFIADVTARGDTPLIITSIAVMSLFVVVMNKFLWRRLYALAERRFRLD